MKTFLRSLVLCVFMAVPSMAMATYVCGVDSDGSGSIDSSSEYQDCEGSGDDVYCPIGAQQCTDTTTSETGTIYCSQGSYSSSKGKCAYTYKAKWCHRVGGDRNGSLECSMRTYTGYVDVQYKCSDGTIQSSSTCSVASKACPLGDSYACVTNSSDGNSYCSATSCADDGTETDDETGPDGTMLTDNGETDDDGNCLDSIYIFNGRGMRCRKAGLSTAFQNCCASTDSVLNDSVGSSYYYYISSGIGAIKAIYTGVMAAYEVYEETALATGWGASEIFATSGGAIEEAFEEGASSTFNPYAIAASIAIQVMLEYVLNACDEMDMETAMMRDSGYCHDVGSYCAKKIPLIGCVQKAESYCCFDSKLARIIQEQGRDQLTTFDGFGTAGDPDCRGFTTDEFSSLDFSLIDLSEYYEDMTENLDTDVESDISDAVNDFYNESTTN